MSRFWDRNWLGVLAIALAAMSFASFIGAAVWSDYLGLPPEAFVFLVSPIAAAASIFSGIAAVLRARRGRGGLAMAVAGLAAGGVLTVLLAIWFLVITGFIQLGGD